MTWIKISPHPIWTMKESTDSPPASDRHKNILRSCGVLAAAAGRRREPQLGLCPAVYLLQFINGVWGVGGEREIDFNLDDLWFLFSKSFNYKVYSALCNCRFHIHGFIQPQKQYILLIHDWESVDAEGWLFYATLYKPLYIRDLDQLWILVSMCGNGNNLPWLPRYGYNTWKILWYFLQSIQHKKVLYLLQKTPQNPVKLCLEKHSLVAKLFRQTLS